MQPTAAADAVVVSPWDSERAANARPLGVHTASVAHRKHAREDDQPKGMVLLRNIHRIRRYHDGSTFIVGPKDKRHKIDQARANTWWGRRQ